MPTRYTCRWYTFVPPLFVVHQVAFDLSSENTLQIPIMMNPKKIAAHTQLVVLDDLTLIKLAKQMKSAK